MTMIMVSYRRADAPDMAGRISDYLVAKYGEKSIFFDVNSIATGIDYRRRIESAIRGSDVMIAVIGLHWLGQNPDGQKPRIHDPGDPVRVEIETALAQKVPIFPLLVNGAKMPEESELPDVLHELHYNNAAKVDSGQDFRMHMARLIESINATVGPPDPTSVLPMPWRFDRRSIYAAAVLFALAATAVVFWSGTWLFARPTVNLNSPAVPAALSTRARANGGFILPDSDQRPLSEEDLKGFSAMELRVARNEIYARHGRFFVDRLLADYFSQFSWYHPRVVEVELSPMELTNANTIQVAERQR
jgi:hypothetical protein